MTTLQTPLGVVATATASGTLQAGRHTPVDATAGPLTMTLPTPANIGARVRVEKVDASANAVTVSGTIRGTTNSTISLVWQYESVELVAESLSSWRPGAGHKPKAGLDATYAQRSANLSDLASPTTARTNLGAAADSAVVHNTGNEAIGGVKTFTLSPSIPTPSGSSDAASKGYVDAAVTVFPVAAPTGVAATDTAAIQAAITAAQATVDGGVVQLRAGVYEVNAALTINPYRCSIVGVGPQHTTIEFSGLSAGQYAITFAINNGTEPAAKRLPFVGLRDLTVRQATPYDATWHCVRMGTDVTGIDGYGVAFDRVKIEGFGDQVTYLSRTYISAWTNCTFYAAQNRGVVLPTATTAGERITFTACLFQQSPGTLVEISGTGTDAYFYGCSFDYSGRALNITGGQAQFFGCHFEADNAHQGSFHEYILINRNGSNPLPQVLISGGMFFPWWTNYDTAIRVTGTTFGEAILQIRDLRVFSDATTTCPYLIRDDGPTAANIAYSGIVFADTTVTLPKYRDQSGVDYPITHLGGIATAKSARPVRRTNVTAIEPIPAHDVSTSGTVTSGTIYHVYFRPTEDIPINKVAMFIAGTAAAGNTLSKVAVFESGAGGALTLRAQSSGAQFGGSTFSRAEVALTTGWTCLAGKIYTLSVLFVGGTQPALATIPTVGGYVLTSSTYGHPVCQQTTGQTDMPASIAAGSLGGGSLLPYLVGSAV